MEKTNPLYQKDYPEWKKNLWGMLRAFTTAFLPMFGFLLSSVTIETLQDKEILVKFVVSVLFGSVVAGLRGLGSYLRDLYPDNTVLARLPV